MGLNRREFLKGVGATLALAAAWPGDPVKRAASVATEQLRGRYLYVAPHGSDSADGMSYNTALQTLAEVEKRLQPGDTVFVGPGKYTEPLDISSDGLASVPIHVCGCVFAPESGIIITPDTQGSVTGCKFESCGMSLKREG